MSKERRLWRKQINTFAGIASIAVIIIYVVNLGLNPEQPKPAPRNINDLSADRIGTGLIIQSFNQQGQLSQKLSTDLAEFFSQGNPENLYNAQVEDSQNEEFFNDSTDEISQSKDQPLVKMQNPVIKLFDGGKSTTEINANEATLDYKTSIANLEGGVRVISSINRTLLLTEKLQLDTSLKQIISKDTVKILSPNSSTTALGIQGNLTDERWQLLSNVKSTITDY